MARGWVDGGDQGAWLDLSAQRGEEGLEQVVADALATAGESVEEALARQGRSLLVLDNLEQLPRSAHARVARWVRAAPSLRVLGTSRGALRLDEEETVEVPPLALPAGDPRQSAAWALLEDAAPRGVLRGVGEAAARRLLYALDGLPLALVLAAGRLEALGFDELVARSTDRLSTLADPERPPGKGGSLRASLAWSWSLLRSPEQEVWATAAVFRGSFDLDELGEVLGGHSDPLDRVHTLVRRHLVFRDGDRYRMLGVIRDFGRRQLLAAERAARAARHAAVFADLAEAALRGPDGVAQLGADARTEMEAVLDRAVADASLVPAAERCTAALAASLQTRGRPPALEAFTRRALDLLAPGDPPEGRPLVARLSMVRATALRRLGDPQGALAALDRAERALPAGEESPLWSVVAHHRGDIANTVGDRATARRHYEQALSLAEGPQRALLLAKLAGTPPDPSPEAEAQIDVALRQLGGSPPPAYEIEVRKRQGRLAMLRGDASLAFRAFGRVRALAEETDNLHGVAFARWHLAVAADVLEDRPDEADADYTFAIEELARLGAHDASGVARLNRGQARIRRGASEEGRRDVEAVRAASSAERSEAGATLALLDALEGRGPAPRAEAVVATPALVEPLRSVLEALGRPGRPAGPLPEPVPWSVVDGDGRMGFVAFLNQQLARLRALAHAWVIHRGGRWFQAPAQAPQPVRSGPAARILAALLDARQRTPEAGLGHEALLAAGWPGEAVCDKAGRNRVNVALTTLRRAGLGELIERQGAPSEWRLQPGELVVVEDGVASGAAAE